MSGNDWGEYYNQRPVANGTLNPTTGVNIDPAKTKEKKGTLPFSFCGTYVTECSVAVCCSPLKVTQKGKRPLYFSAGRGHGL
jgi:hypothetical protein